MLCVVPHPGQGLKDVIVWRHPKDTISPVPIQRHDDLYPLTALTALCLLTATAACYLLTTATTQTGLA